MISLVILAAGMGSRFGGLKQITPLGPNGEFIIDYSIYDAIKVGFKKVIFVIKEENYDIFKETIGSRVEDKIEVSYVFQKNDILPLRTKPLGTAHAIMACKGSIDGPFMVINADDYYGYDAFKKGFDFLSNMDTHTYGLVCYKAINTLTENGSVKRGLCKISNGYLTDIVESSIIKVGEDIKATSLIDNITTNISSDSLVSMNMLLFNETLFNYLDEDFDKFILNIKDKMEDEFLIPTVLEIHIKNKDIKVKIIDTSATWYGVTYKNDVENVSNALETLHKKGIYPKKLW